MPNSTTTNYLKTQADIDAECNKNWSKGVIFINQDAKGFYSLDSEKQNSCIMHEVGHALKLSHSDENTSRGYEFRVLTLMSKVNSTVNNDITLYDKASLIKKWRDMP